MNIADSILGTIVNKNKGDVKGKERLKTQRLICKDVDICLQTHYNAAMTPKIDPQEIVVVETEEEYQAELALGLEEDEVLQPGRHIFRRGGFLARHPGASPTDTSPAHFHTDAPSG
ncbi:MAG: hypothetical protein HY328_11315 [Chloroflexi bacterium]|nr:hypothetical protein [Chloroflexota bacterium]